MPNDSDYAIVIGVEHYITNDPLGGPHADTKDFTEWLTDSVGGSVPRENIGIFLSTPDYQPTQHEIDRWFNKIFTLIKPDQRGRRLYFYFSGHGVGVNASNSAMLLPEWSFTMRNYGLSSEKYLRQLVNIGSFEEIFFFMDCCRNRIPGVEGQPPFWGAAKPSSQSCESLLYYASQFDNAAYEDKLETDDKPLDNQLPHGLFTKVLLNGLRGAACAREGRLTVQDLVNYMKRELPVLAKSVGKIQIPRPGIEIDLEKEITGRFSKTVKISIEFNTPGLEIILEGPDLNVEKAGNSSEGRWDLELIRGRYSLRRSTETEGKQISVDGLKTIFSYE